MNKKRKRKLLTLPAWNIEELESWFMDMSLQGWKLIKLNYFFATFEEMEPRLIQYRCEIFKLEDPSEVNRIEMYEDAGWEHIASREYVQIFREIENLETVEIHTDPHEQAETLNTYKKSLFTKGILSLVFILIIFALQFIILLNNSVQNYLDDYFLYSLFIIMVYLYLATLLISGMFHIHKLKKKLLQGYPLQHRKPYKGKMYGQLMAMVFIISIASLFLITTIRNSQQHIFSERHPVVPNHSLPTLQLADLLDEAIYQESERVDQGSPLNHYSVRSSFFVPIQIILSETLRIDGVDGEESDTYRLWSEYYEVRNPWLATHFFQTYKESFDAPFYNFDKIDDTPLDELWIDSDSDRSYLLIRKGKAVYYISFTGDIPLEEILNELYAYIL